MYGLLLPVLTYLTLGMTSFDDCSLPVQPMSTGRIFEILTRPLDAGSGIRPVDFHGVAALPCLLRYDAIVDRQPLRSTVIRRSGFLRPRLVLGGVIFLFPDRSCFRGTGSNPGGALFKSFLFYGSVCVGRLYGTGAFPLRCFFPGN